MSIFEIINQSVPLTPELLQVLQQEMVIESFKKGETVVRVGEICQKAYFVNKGVLRLFYYSDAGKDITQWFGFEETIIFEVDSFFRLVPSEFGIDALEDTLALTITNERLNYILDNYPQLERFGRIFATEMALKMGDKVKDLQFRTAKERYNTLIEKHPDIIKRVSLGHISSYLGITQQSLSRIRGQK